MNIKPSAVRISAYGSSRSLSSSMRKSFILLPAFALAMVGTAEASSKTWDPGLTPATGSNGNGTWTNGSGATWSTGAADTTFATTDDAVVGVAGGSGTYTIGIATAGVTANTLTLNNAGTGTYVFGNTGNFGTLTLSSSSTALTVNNNTIFNTTVNLGSGTGSVAFNAANTSLTYNAGGALGAGLGGTGAATATESINTGAYTVGGAGQTFNIGNAGTFGTNPGVTTPTSGFIINAGATLTTSASFATGQGANGLTTVNGGTINNSGGGYIIVGRAAAGSTFGRVMLNTGTITGLNMLINHQGTAGATGGGELDINGGTLNETGQIAVGSSAAGGNAILNIAGGVATIGQINFGSLAGQAISTGGTGTVNLSGGTLYIGAGGINNVATGSATYAINLSGGTLGVTADLSTPLNMTLTGTTTIQAADSGAVAHNISLSGNLTGTGAINKTGAGTLNLSGSNASTLGALTVNAGAVQFANENAFYGGSSITSTSAAKVSAGNGGTLALNVGGAGEFTSSDVATLAANGTFATGSAIALDTTDASGSFTASSGLAGSFGLTKQGVGTLALTGANTYTGATTVNGGTLDIGGGGATGSINSSSALVLNNGTLSLTETGGASQTFAGATFGGNSSVQAIVGDTLALGALTRSGLGLIDFSSTGTITTTTANDASGILGVYATVGGTSWAANNGSGVIVPYAAYTQTSVALNTAANYSGKNIDVNSSQSPGAITPNSLRFNTGAAETLTLTGTSSLADGGILVTSNVGANVSTITGTGSTIEGSAGGNLTVDQNNTAGALSIASIIANNGTATGLVKNGAGTLTLSGANTFTGATVLNAGVLSLASANALNTAALNGGLTFLGGTLQYNGSTTDYSNTIKNSTSAISVDINGKAVTWASAIAASNTGGLTLTDTSAGGTGVLSLTNATNLFSGPININSGILLLGNTTAFGNASAINVASGGALQLNPNRTLYGPLLTLNGAGPTGNGALEITLNSPSYEGNVALGSNSTIGADGASIFGLQGAQLTNNGFALTFTGSGTINSTSNITGSGALIKAGTGTVNLNDTSLYSGGTTIKSGVLAAGAAGALGSGTVTLGDSSGTANATLNIGASAPFTNALNVASGSTGNTLALQFTSGNGTYSGPITLGHDLVINNTTAANTATISGGGISGTGNVTINNSSTGIVTFSAASSYTGTMTVATGPVTLANTSAASTGPIFLGSTSGSTGATLNEGVSLSNALTVVSGTTGVLTLASTSGNNTFSGAITLGTTGSQNLTIASSSGGVNVWSGGITGSGNLTINATNGGSETFSGGALNFAGTITNSGTGAAPTTISSAIGANVTGITQNSSTSALTLSGTNTSYAGSVTDTLGTIKMGGGSALNASNTVLLNAASATTATFDLNANAETIAGLNSSGTGTDIVTNSSTAGARVLTLGGSGTYSYGGTITGTSNLALTMAGSGTQTLSGANTYTGTTTLAGGVLNAGGADTGSGTTATAGALGAGSSAITFTGGTLQYSSASASTDYSGRIKSSTGAIKVDTNSQNVTYAAALASTNAGGLTKLGAGTLTLTGADAYTGATTVSAGTLQIGNGTAGSIVSSSAVSVAASSTLGLDLVNTGTFSNNIADSGTVAGTETGSVANTVSGVISGTGGFSQTGTGTTTLTGANTYTGATSITAGTVVANNAGTAGSSSALGQNSAVTMGTTAGTLTLGANVQIGSLAGGGTGGNVGLSTFTLTDGGNNTNTTYAGVISSGTGGGLTKIGTGTQILSGANTYTGATTINGGTLQIGNGTTGSLASTTAVTLGGGTLSILGKTSGTTAQTIASLTATATTSSTILLTPNGGTSTTLTVTTGSAATAGSSVNFNYAAGTTNGATVGNDIVVWAPTGVTAGTLIGSGYTVTDAGGSGFATINASNDVVRNTTNTALPVSGGSSTTNYNVNSGFSTSSTTTPGSLVEALSGNVAANTVTVDTTGLASGANLALGANALTITGGGGILFTGANAYAITGTGGIKFSTGGSSIDLDNFDTNTVTISAPILNNGGTNSVIVNGTGTTVLGGTNTYSGGTAVNGGTVNLTGTVASAVTVNSGATLNIGSGGKITSGGVILNNGAGYSENAAGVISGGSVFTVSTGNTGTYTVAGANTYTGATTINGGTVNIGGASVFGVSGPLGNSSNTALANVAGTTLNLNGFDLVIGDLTGGGTLGGNVNLGGNTLTLNNGGGVFAGIISGTGAVVKTNVTNSAEEFTGANTYSGGTTIKAGILEAGSNTAFGTGGITLGDSTGSLNAQFIILNTVSVANPLTVAAGSSGNTLALVFQSQNDSYTGAITLANNLTISNNGSGNPQVVSGGITGTGNLSIGTNATSGTGSSITFSTNPINFNGSILNNEGAAGSTAAIFSAPIGSLVTSVTENSATSKLALAAANTYTGPTTITTGTLMLGGSGNALTATAAGSISTSSTISGSGTFAINRTNAVAQGVDFSGAALGGALSFSQIGTGTTTLTAANTYTGVTTISAGALQLGDGTSGHDGSIAGASIVNSTALVFDPFSATAYTGVISGAGTVAMSGTGTVTLSGANTYTGSTTLNSGIVNVNAADVASTSGALGNGGTITFKGGTLQYGAAAATSDYSTRIVSSTSAISVDTNGQNVTYNGALAASNTGGLTKLGAGTLTLGSASNAYTGTTTIAGGTLAFNAAGDLNGTSLLFSGGTLELTANNVSLSQLATITAGTTATFQVDGSSNLTLAGGATETTSSGALTKTGTGTLTFTAANAYTGLTTINGGVVDYQNNTAFSAGPITVNSGGTARVEDLIATGTPTITISGSGATGALGALESSGPTGNLFMGALVLGADATISSDSSGSFFELAGSNVTGNHTLTVAGAGETEIDDTISTGSGGVTMNGSGLLLLTGANTYTGPTTVNSGTVQAGGPTVAGVSGAFGVNSAVTVANVSGATVDLNGNDTQIGSLAGGGSTGGSVLLGSNTLTTGADNTNTTFGGVISGTSGKLVKIGTGAQTLTGNNTYTGGTTISKGALYVNNTSGSGTGTGAILVSSGGTLGGGGTIKPTGGAGVTISSGGTLASGALQTANAYANGGSGAVNGTGTGGGLTLNNTEASSSLLKVNGGTTLTFALGSTTAYSGGSGALNFANPNTDSTFLNITGNTIDQIFSNSVVADNINLIDLTNGSGSVSLTLRSQNPYLLIQTALGTNADFANLVTTGGTGANGYVLGVSNGSGGYTAFNLGAFDINGNQINTSTNLEGLQLYLYNGDLEVVPEPGTWALMLGGLASLLLVQKLRRRNNT